MLYEDPWKQFKIKLLSQIDYFSQPGEPTGNLFLEEVQYYMEQELVSKGSIILQQDRPINSIIFVVQGTVIVEVGDHVTGDFYSLMTL